MSLGRETLRIVPRNTASHPILKMLEIKADDIASSLAQATRSQKNKTEGFIKKGEKKKRKTFRQKRTVKF